MAKAQDVEELTNDIFVKIFFNIKSYHADYPFETWIRAIAVNACIDKYRSMKSNLDLLHHELGDNEVADKDWDIDLENIQILPMIKNLPDKYKLVFNLYVFEEYSHKEISDLLNISIGTSKSCLSRAKHIIRTYIQENSIEPQSIING